MKETAKLIGVLTAICLVAGLLLAWVNMLTAAPIAQAMKAERMEAIRKVLPDYDNAPDTDTLSVEEGERTWKFYVARRQGQYAGAAFQTSSTKGYGGQIVVMTGVNAQGKVHGIEILDQKETPGLGARIKDLTFRTNFADLSIKDTRWALRKDGGDVDQITAATISSGAVVDAVKAGVDVYIRHEETIRTVGGE